MNLYTRARKHIDMSRVKEIREQHKEKKLLQEYNRRKELVALRDNHSPEFSNWRNNITEGMSTGNVYFTTLPSTGDVDLETIDTDVESSFETAGGNAAFNNTEVTASGSGTGSDGGFAIGNHLAFQGDGHPRWAILKPIDSSKFDNLTINAIRGNDENGGEDPDIPGEELRLYYLPPGGSAFRSISVNQDGQQVLPADSDVIIPLGKDNSGLKDYSISLPSYARGVAFRYMLYQLFNNGDGFDNFGVKNVKYKRKGPVSIFVSLDSPEAVAFISDGSGGMTAEQKKKRLDDMLAASDEYQSKQFPFNKAAYEKAAQDVARNIQVSLDPSTFDFPDDPITIDKLFDTKITDTSTDEDVERYLEQRGLSIDTLTKDNIRKNFNNDEERLLVINNGNTEIRDKFLTAMGYDMDSLYNLTNKSYDQLNDENYNTLLPFIPGGTPSTGWDGKVYYYKDPALEYSRIVPAEVYKKAKQDPDWYGAERPDIAYPGSRYVMKKPYSFSQDGEARPYFTGPQNKDLKEKYDYARSRIFSVGSYSDLGFQWDLGHFENGLGSGAGSLSPGSNFAREQVVQSMTAVLRHMYWNTDELAYGYALDAFEKNLDTTLPYDPLYVLLESDQGRRALDIATNSTARQLDYKRSGFPNDEYGQINYEQHLIENDRTIEAFKEALESIKRLNTNFNLYDVDEWYKTSDTSGYGQTVGEPLKAHPYLFGITEPPNPDEPVNPDEPNPDEPDKEYPTQLNDIGGEAWKNGNVITKDGFKKSDGDYDVFVAGGGNAKMAQGYSYEQVMEIGKQNLNVLSVKNLDNKSDTKFKYENGELKPIGSSVPNETINNAINMSASLAMTLGISILTGQSRELKLGDKGKTDMIKNVDPNQFTSALKFGPAIRPTVDNAVYPTPGKKLNVFTGLWGAPGGAEVDYDPKTDTLTFTSNKMLRKGEDGDEYNEIGTVITRFGDIPTPSQSDITSKSAAIITSLYGAIGINPPGGQSPEQFIPQLAQHFNNNQFANGLIGAATQLMDFTTQGTASNIVALRKLMTNARIVPTSDMEQTYGGYGHVYTQTSYTGDEIPPELRNIINNKNNSKQLGDGSLGDTLQGTGATDAATASGSQQKKKEDEIAQAGPGYRPRPGNDAAGNRERLGTDKTWDPHMRMWVPNIPKASNNKGTMVAHYIRKGKTLKEMYEPKAKHNDKVAKVTGRLKSVSDFLNHADVKPVFPKDPPPEMINGRHPDLVDGEKVSDRFNKLDPISAKAMPKTGNPKIDAKVDKARRESK